MKYGIIGTAILATGIAAYAAEAASATDNMTLKGNVQTQVT